MIAPTPGMPGLPGGARRRGFGEGGVAVGCFGAGQGWMWRRVAAGASAVRTTVGGGDAGEGGGSGLCRLSYRLHGGRLCRVGGDGGHHPAIPSDDVRG